MDERLILPKIKKIQETVKNISNTTQTTSKSDLVNIKDKVLAISLPIKIVENTT